MLFSFLIFWPEDGFVAVHLKWRDQLDVGLKNLKRVLVIWVYEVLLLKLPVVGNVPEIRLIELKVIFSCFVLLIAATLKLACNLNRIVIWNHVFQLS
jgi:hypothetical protein